MQEKPSSSEKIFNLDNQANKLGMGGKLSQDSDEISYKKRMQQRKDIQSERLQIRKVKKGLLIVFTGNGKGKTTASLGMALRTIGHGYKVAIIQFPNNAIIPDNSADKVLEEIVKFKDEKKLRLVGHASKTGSETIEGKRINMEISISRAQTIKNMLINKGFDGNNIDVLGKGDLEPLKEEAEEFGEAVNRRVEVFFISN